MDNWAQKRPESGLFAGFKKKGGGKGPFINDRQKKKEKQQLGEAKR